MSAKFTRGVGTHPFVWILLATLVGGGIFWAISPVTRASGSAASSSPAPQPSATPLKPGDDPSYDWEAPGRPQATDSGTWTYAIKPTFSSSRTLEQTETWLKWAMEAYGRVQQPADSYEISDVKFSGCSMQWDEKRFMEHGDYVNERIYTLKLADIDLAYGTVQAYGGTLKFGDAVGLSNPQFNILERFWVKDGLRMKANGERNSRDSSAVLTLQDKDDISRRIGWALVHAVRLCGGRASR